MVQNKTIILDEGIKKNVAECNNMSDEEYLTFHEFRRSWTNLNHDLEFRDWKEKDCFNEISYLVKHFISDQEQMMMLATKSKNKDFDYYHKLWNSRPYKCAGYSWNTLMKQMYTILRKERFIHQYMINISPDWKGKTITGKMCTFFEEAIVDYLQEGNRWVDAHYTLESGGEGNFLHAHIVAKPNIDLIKSVDTHIAKGTHKYQLMKQFDKQMSQSKTTDGYAGCLKGKYSVQRIILRNKDLIDDKLDYLVEEKKPDGHKNKSAGRPADQLNQRHKWICGVGRVW